MARQSDRRGSSGKSALREPSAPDLPTDFAPGTLPDHDLEDGGVYEELAFNEIDLSEREAAGAEIEACRFVSVTMSQVTLRRALIRDVAFDRCDLANLRALDSSFTRVAISACRMTGALMLDVALRDVTFDRSRVDLSSFRASKFEEVVFADCRMEQADFGDADLRGARFEGCTMTGAQFSGARMSGTRFSRCELTGISGVTSMRGAVITSTDAVALADILANALGIKIEDE